MKYFIKTMLVVWLPIISLVSVPAARADEIYTVTGVIEATDRDSSIIEIAQEVEGDIIIYVIHGFPFGNLEAQLTKILDDSNGITIEVGDCVMVEYFKRELNSGEVVNKWEFLMKYCENEDCTESCYEDDALARKPQQSNRPFSWPGKGNPEPPGKALGLPN